MRGFIMTHRGGLTGGVSAFGVVLFKFFMCYNCSIFSKIADMRH